MIKKIAITGGIGSGKTTASKILSEILVCPAWDNDLMVNQIYNEDCKEIFKYHDILNKNGSVDKNKLKSSIIKDSSYLNQICKILYPILKNRMNQIIKNSEDNHIIFEVPMLFESEFDKLFDLTINIHSDYENKLSRLMKKNIDPKLLKIIIENQISNEVRKEKSDITIINNNENYQELYNRLKELSSSLL